MINFECQLRDESESLDFAGLAANCVQELNGFHGGLIFYLKGDLGAGKSFFSRAFIQHFIPEQKVKSPTYSIVETYNFSTNSIHHLDLYRLCDPEELEYLAIRDMLSGDFVALVEWPQRGYPILPDADVELEFSYLHIGESLGRSAEMKAVSQKGADFVEKLRAQVSD